MRDDAQCVSRRRCAALAALAGALSTQLAALLLAWHRSGTRSRNAYQSLGVAERFAILDGDLATAAWVAVLIAPIAVTGAAVALACRRTLASALLSGLAGGVYFILGIVLYSKGVALHSGPRMALAGGAICVTASLVAVMVGDADDNRLPHRRVDPLRRHRARHP